MPILFPQQYYNTKIISSGASYTVQPEDNNTLLLFDLATDITVVLDNSIDYPQDSVARFSRSLRGQ